MERVAFPLAGGGEVVVEVDDVPQGRQLASRGGGVGRQAQKTFEEAAAGIRPIADAILAQVKAVQPDSVAVEFGIKLSASAGVILTSAAGEAHCKITLTWKKP